MKLNVSIIILLFFQVKSSTIASKSVVLSSVAADDDEFDEPNKEFLPETNLVSKKSTRSNVSNDEFDLDDEDSRQLSIDQSFPESRQSESGKYLKIYCIIEVKIINS